MNLWNQPGIPHSGWWCEYMFDLGYGNYQSCQMCGNERVRYVHFMRNHELYDRQLEVGCICAGKMEGDIESAKYRDQKFKSRVTRKSRWLQKKWRWSKNGNTYINIDDFNLGVFFRHGEFGYWIDGDFGREKFKTMNEAKLALFDAFEDL